LIINRWVQLRKKKDQVLFSLPMEHYAITNVRFADGTYPHSITVGDGKIQAIDAVTLPAKTLDAEGLVALAGGIDDQVHFRDPGLTHKEDLQTGSQAAAAGGITSFFEMPNTSPTTTTFEAMEAKKKRASQVCVVNYAFFAGATAENREFCNTVPNVPGIKIFMGSSTGDLLVDEEEVLEHFFSKGSRIIAVHAEDEKTIRHNQANMSQGATAADHPRIRSVEAALIATRRAMKLSKKYQRDLHILHLTTAEEVALLREDKPSYISAEVCPQHMFLDTGDYTRLGNFLKMNPPVRGGYHREALFNALRDGVIDFIATDHAPHLRGEKQVEYAAAPAGMPGVETSLPLMLNQVNLGRCTLRDVARWMSEAVAERFNVVGKGKLLPGYDADIVLVDMKKEKTVTDGQLFTKTQWSPYNGWTLKGWPVYTIVNGQIVFAEGSLSGTRAGQEVVFASQGEG